MVHNTVAEAQAKSPRPAPGNGTAHGWLALHRWRLSCVRATQLMSDLVTVGYKGDSIDRVVVARGRSVTNA